MLPVYVLVPYGALASVPVRSSVPSPVYQFLLVRSHVYRYARGCPRARTGRFGALARVYRCAREKVGRSFRTLGRSREK